ncbi:MAG TPA: hypothetical protein VHB78_04565 [Vicinamibacterales bacterium]|nr:hypothetical protein [Vicinamibacterales bacterium]
MATSSPLPAQRRFGETNRRDAWWLQPAIVFFGFTAFIVYSTWAGFSNANYEFGPYLSPMYSPLLFGPSPHSWFGGPAQPAWWPPFLHFSAAALILWGPVGFRLTCYYYRGAYYKAFWADPVACAVGEPRKTYLGERWFPLVIQNIHRYFLYVAICFIAILTWDAWKALWFPADGSMVLEAGTPTTFGIGVGTIVMTLNVIFLGCYTFGCHSLRHLVGGVLDVMSGRPVRKNAYKCVSCLNRWHMKWAWTSLIWVGFTDLYVRLCAMGVWHDVRLF